MTERAFSPFQTRSNRAARLAKPAKSLKMQENLNRAGRVAKPLKLLALPLRVQCRPLRKKAIAHAPHVWALYKRALNAQSGACDAFFQESGPRLGKSAAGMSAPKCARSDWQDVREMHLAT